MNFSRYSTIKLIAIVCVTYTFFVVGIVWVDALDFKTAMRIDLTDPAVCQVYLREGVERSSNLDPEADAENWMNVTGKSWSIGKSGFAQPYKQPMFTPTDLPVRYYTYQMNFFITSDNMAHIRRNALVPGLYIEAIADNWEIFVNGNLIKREVYLDENGDIINHRNVSSCSIPFDKSYLKEGENALTFHIAVHPNTLDAGIYYNSEVYIDDFDAIEKSHAEFFMIFFTGITAFMGFYHLLVFLGNIKDRKTVYFAFVHFLLTVYIFANTGWISILIMNSQVAKSIEYGSMTLLPIFTLLFTKEVAEERMGIVMWALTAVQAAVAVAMPFGGVQFSLDLLLLSEALVFISIVYCVITAVKWLRKVARDESPDGKVTGSSFVAVLLRTVMGNTLVGLIFFLMAAIFGAIRSNMMDSDQDSMVIGLFAFVLVVSFSLQNEVTETRHQVVHHNEELEEMVRSRTRDLEKQTELAINASKTKSRFLATMSHEIRTPMNAIIGISEILLQRADLHNQVRDGILKMHNSGQSLLGIINDILDLSKAETGRLEIIPSEFSLPSLINDTIQLNIGRIASKPIEFTLSLSEDLPEKLIGDELRIKQILTNILSNAFKYTERGSVGFAIDGVKTKKGFEMHFTVSDTGQGMHEEELKILFDEYARFNKIANRKTEGTGLGMNITGQLVDLMHGKIDVVSTFGQGSTFVVSLPLSVSPGTPVLSARVRERLCNFTFGVVENIGERSKALRDYMPYGTVLVVDDVETNLYVAEGLLRPYGVVITTAASGFAAIDLIRQGNTYDIIFMDHMMPEMDGIEAVKTIRRMGYKLPIAALTANAIVGNETLFKESGFDDYISKPIDIRDLNRTLVKYIRERHPEQPKMKPPAAQSLGCSSQDVNPKLWAVFIRDVKKAVLSLPEQYEQGDLAALAITAHGMKSAAANVGEISVSEMANAVEHAAKEDTIGEVSEILPTFLLQLRSLLEKTEKPQQNPAIDKRLIPDDLQKELLAKAAQFCEDYNESGVNGIFAQMRNYALSENMATFLDKIEEYLLHAEFENAEAEIIRKQGSL